MIWTFLAPFQIGDCHRWMGLIVYSRIHVLSLDTEDGVLYVMFEGKAVLIVLET